MSAVARAGFGGRNINGLWGCNLTTNRSKSIIKMRLFQELKLTAKFLDWCASQGASSGKEFLQPPLGTVTEEGPQEPPGRFYLQVDSQPPEEWREAAVPALLRTSCWQTHHHSEPCFPCKLRMLITFLLLPALLWGSFGAISLLSFMMKGSMVLYLLVFQGTEIQAVHRRIPTSSCWLVECVHAPLTLTEHR